MVTFAQRYELEEVKAGRYEVTNRLDARPDSGAVRVVAPYRHAVDSMMSPVLGESEVAMRADRPESLLSNLWPMCCVRGRSGWARWPISVCVISAG